jgi:hypothetical protein
MKSECGKFRLEVVSGISLGVVMELFPISNAPGYGVVFSFSSVESQTWKVADRLPVGTRIRIAGCPEHPNRSIAEL